MNPHEPFEVIAVVGPVAGVFGGDESVDQVDGNIAVGNVNSVVRVKECAEQCLSVLVENAGFSRKDLQDIGPVEQIVRIAFGKDLEHDDIEGYAAN